MRTMSADNRRDRGAGDIESRRIARLRRLLEREDPVDARRIRLGVGDDSALWRPRAGRDAVLSVDTQAEGTHFQRHWMSPREIGRRAISAAVSDLAAMAARPAALLIALLLPDDVDESSFRGLLRGIVTAARDYRATVVGGNTSRGPLSVTTTAIGEVETGRALRRDALRIGDEVWVTGYPGLAGLGWQLLERDGVNGKQSADERRALAAFRKPQARVEEARAIARSLDARAAIDLSDGLARDLGHLVEETRLRGRSVGVEIDANTVAGLCAVPRLAARLGLEPLATALEGGEDYELCFTAPAGRVTPVRVRRFEKRFGTRLTRVGKVVREPGLWLLGNTGDVEPLEARGFRHF